ncbi:MAG: methyltransferase domain-containing protein [Candidatus Harrisonbacteria bacterium]|nr:methyltransferase domain-containing protein [Candidatus Harrisonbacteria bacterium]
MIEENRIFDYFKVRLEELPCNLCGKDNFAVLAKRSGNGLLAQTCMCRNCGLIYINPRMTKAGYDDYYKYFYRQDRASAKGRNLVQSEKNNWIEQNFLRARKFGLALGGLLKDYFKPGLTIDIGSSTGGVLYGLREAIGNLDLLGIEPSIAESNFANQKGVKTLNALFENIPEKEIGKAANILCVQSLNHLLDPRSFFQRCFEYLQDGGCLILSVKNFRHQARRAGSIEAGVQIDHPFMFTPETLKLFVESVGFKVVYLDVDEGKSEFDLRKQRNEGLSRHHIRLAAEKPEKWAGGRMAGVSKPDVYWKSRLQFWKPYVKLYYWLFYSHRLSFLRKTF